MSDRRDSTHVVLADDDDAMRETFAIWLRDRGHWQVREASDGVEALDLLDGTVDVLVLDRQMPKLSGPEVVERLDDTHFDGTVVVTSAYEPDDHLDATDVDDYLTKPIDRAEFVDCLERSVPTAASDD